MLSTNPSFHEEKNERLLENQNNLSIFDRHPWRICVQNCSGSVIIEYIITEGVAGGNIYRQCGRGGGERLNIEAQSKTFRNLEVMI